MSAFQADADVIRWRLHLQSSPEAVFQRLATDDGRASFWAEEARQHGDAIEFRFPDRSRESARVLVVEAPARFVVEYFGARTVFELAGDDAGGTVLTLTAHNVPAEERSEVIAGWASVLLCLKAAADFGVDLRNHDPARSWAHGFVDN